MKNTNISDLSIFIDESGLPNSHDPEQSWFVLAGVSLPSNQVAGANEYFDSCTKKYIPEAYLENEKFEIKGQEILNPNESKRVLGMDFQTRIKLARELLCINLSVRGIEFYVTAINAKEFNLQKEKLSFPWVQRYLPKNSLKLDLLSLAEIVGDFCFKLEHMFSQQRNFDCQAKGCLVIDESPRYKKAMNLLEKILREDRSIEFSEELKISFQLVKDNVMSPFRMDDSRKHPLIQISDLLAALVRLKYEKCQLPDLMEELFWETKKSFQNNSHSYPTEPDLDLKFLGTSAHRFELLKKSCK